jgi:hypothetical protein
MCFLIIPPEPEYTHVSLTDYLSLFEQSSDHPAAFESFLYAEGVTGCHARGRKGAEVVVSAGVGPARPGAIYFS